VDRAHYVHIIGDDTVRLMVTWDGGFWFHVHIIYTDSHQALHVDSFERDSELTKSFGAASDGCQEWAKSVVSHWEEDNINGDNWKEIYSDA
jgi:hypothetical protein